MMEIVWRNPHGNRNGILPRSACVVQIRSEEPESGQVQIIYRRAVCSDGPVVEFEVLVNRKKPVHAA